jgi:hypothetical protein
MVRAKGVECAVNDLFLLIISGLGDGQQKTPRLPVRGFANLASCFCLRAGSSRTWWRGNKDEDDERRRAAGRVVAVRQGRVALQHVP